MKVFFSFAHPDDETFTVGGLINKLHQKDLANIILYCATPGDAGKCGEPPVCSKEQLGEVRKKELEKASEILGVDKLITSTFQDGQLTNFKDELTTELEQILIEHKPEIVVTFPAHGISGHKDHIAIHEVTTEIVNRNNFDFIKKLYYATFPEEVKGPRAYLEKMFEIDVVVELSTENSETVKSALLCHRTQNQSVNRVFKGLFNQVPFKKFNNKEYLVLALDRDSTIDIRNLY
ncbi:MAG: N-acetylglucosaminylphosphatidylinositol deacetylase [Bacillales bacterium]|jgi:LmbE family N-acetylglucosaminyl deacetylase|nr:N-acetylglucosaminylphosphatidylinositol deacetylase [Bacillales bacterium]